MTVKVTQISAPCTVAKGQSDAVADGYSHTIEVRTQSAGNSAELLVFHDVKPLTNALNTPSEL